MDTMNITPSLRHARTYLCSVRFNVNITHQHDNDRTLQGILLLCMLFSGASGNYVRAACGSWTTGWPPLF